MLQVAGVAAAGVAELTRDSCRAASDRERGGTRCREEEGLQA